VARGAYRRSAQIFRPRKVIPATAGPITQTGSFTANAVIQPAANPVMSYFDTISGDRPLVYYRLGELAGTSAVDEIAAWNATYVNTPTLNGPSALSGDSNPSISVASASSEYVSVPDHPDMFLGDLSYECWFIVNNTSTTMSLIYKGSNGPWLLFLGGGDHRLYWTPADGNRVRTFKNYDDNVWHHAVGTVSGTSWLLYVDGQLDTDVYGANTSITSDALPMFIGAGANGASNYLNGGLDEVAIYPYALTAQQVANHYAAASATRSVYSAVVISDVPRGFWRLDDPSGTTATDDSGNGKNGTYINSPTLGVPGPLSGDSATATTFVAASTQYVSIPDDPSFDFGAADFSLEIWYKRATASAGVQGWLLSKNTAFNMLIEDTGQLKVDNYVSNAFVSTGAIDGDANWHHVVFTRTGSTYIAYLDGAVLPGTSTTQTFSANAEALLIGAESPIGGGGVRFNGSLANAAVYNYVLSPISVRNHYITRVNPTQSYTQKVVADGAFHYWRVGETAGTTADDQVGTLDGTYGGSPTLGATSLLPGDTNTSVTFNGSSQSIATAGDTLSAMGNDGPYSLEFWIKRSNLTAGGSILNKTTHFEAHLGNNNLNLETYNSPQQLALSSITLGTVNAYHCVITRNSTGHGNTKIWIDGVDVTVDGPSIDYTGNATNANPLTIARTPAPDRYVGGKLDEIALYPLVLTPDQVRTHWIARTFVVQAGGAGTFTANAVLKSTRTGTFTANAVIKRTQLSYYSLVRSDGASFYARFGEASGTVAAEEVASLNGTYIGSPTLGVTGALPADTNKAFTPGSTGKYAEFPDGSGKDLGDVFSIELWYKRSTISTFQTVLNAGTNAYNIQINTSNIVDFGKGSVGTSALSSVALTDTTSWHHLVVTKNGAANKIYLDTVDITGTVTNLTMADNTETLKVGWDGGSVGEEFKGSLDELALYKNVVLTQAQITAHYQAASAIAPITVNAIVKDIETRTFTGNAVIKRTQTGSFTANAIVKDPDQPGSYTASAVLKATISSSFTANAVIKSTRTGTYTANAIALKTQGFQNAVLVQQATNTGTGLTVVVTLSAVTAGNALIAWWTDPSVVAVRGIPSGGGVNWAEVDNRGNAWGLVVSAGFYSSGGQTTVTVTFDNGGQKAVNVSEWSGVDSPTGVTTKNGQSISPVTVGGITVDGPRLFLGGMDLLSSSVVSAAGNGFTNLTGVSTATYQLQAAYLFATKPGTYSPTWTIAPTSSWDVINATFNLKATLPITVNAVIKSTRTGTFTANAALVRTVTGTFTANAVLKATRTGTFTANAVIKTTLTGTFTANAVLKKTIAGSYTAAAWVQITRTGTFTANAILKKTQSVNELSAVSFSLDPTAIAFGNISDFTKVAQAFTAGATGSLWRVSYMLSRTGAPADTVEVELWSSAGSTPGSLIGSIASVAAGQLSTTLTVLTTSTVALPLVSGTKYWIVFSRSGATDSGKYYNAGLYTTSVYAGGGTSIWNLSIWSAEDTAFDFYFVADTAFSLTANAVVKATISSSFTANAAIVRTVTGSFTANAVLKATRTGTFTANAVVLRTQTGSFTAAALILRPQPGSFTAAAVIKAAITGSFKADAAIKSTRTGSYTANAVLLKTGTGSFTASALILRPQTGTFTANAVIKSTRTGSFAADAVLKSTRTGSFTANAVVLKTATGSFTANALIVVTRTGTFTANAVVKATITSSFTANAVVKATRTGSFTADAVIRLTRTGSLSADAVIKKTIAGAFTASAWVQITRTGSFTANAVVKATLTGSFSASALIKATISGSYTANAVIFATRSGSFTGNATILRTQTGSFTANAVLARTATSSFTANAVLKSTRTGTFLADAVVKATRTGSLTADAAIKATRTGSYTANAVIFRTQAGSLTVNAVIMPRFSADAVLKRTQTGAYTANAVIMPRFRADAVIKRTQTGTYTVDAWIGGVGVAAFLASAAIKKTLTGSFTGNAVILRTASGSYTANAVIRATFTGSFTASAVVKRTATGAFSADAVLKATRTGSFTANAIVLRLNQTGTFTVNAVVLRLSITGSFTANALLLKTFSGSFSANAVIKATRAGSFTASALILRSQTGSTTANAVIKATRAGSFTADAVIRRTFAGSFTADAWIISPTAGAGSFKGDAVIKATRTGTFVANALILATRTGAYTADATIKATRSGSYTANAVVLASRSGSFTASAVIKASFNRTFVADAVVKRTSTGTFTAAAWIAGGTTAAFSADAIVRATRSATMRADAVLRSSSVGSFTANAIAKRTATGSLTANAVIRATRTGGVTTNAVIATLRTGSLTADAYVTLFVAGGTFLVDAVIQRTRTGTFTASALLRIVRTGSFTARAIIKAGRAGSFTADASVGAAGQRSFTADAQITGPGYGNFTVDASISRHIVQEIESTTTADTIAGTTTAGTIEGSLSAATIAPSLSARTMDFTWFWTRRSYFTLDAEVV